MIDGFLDDALAFGNGGKEGVLPVARLDEANEDVEDLVDGKHLASFHLDVLVDRQSTVRYSFFHRQSMTESLLRVVIDQASDHVHFVIVQRLYYILRLAR